MNDYFFREDLEPLIRKHEASRNAHSEKYIESKACEFAESLGWFQFKLNSVNIRGLPDRMFIRKGIWFAIEFKSYKKTLSPTQKRMKRLWIEMFGMDFHVCDTFGKAVNVIFDESVKI